MVNYMVEEQRDSEGDCKGLYERLLKHIIGGRY